MTNLPGSGSRGAPSAPSTPAARAAPPPAQAPIPMPAPPGPGATPAPATTKSGATKAGPGKTSAKAAARTSPGASATGPGSPPAPVASPPAGVSTPTTDPVLIEVLRDIVARLDALLIAISGGPPDADRITQAELELKAAADDWNLVASRLDAAIARLEQKSKTAPSLVLTDGLRSLRAIAAIVEQEQLWLADAVDHHVDGGARLTSDHVHRREVERFSTAHELLQDIRQGLKGAVPPLVGADLDVVERVTSATCTGIQRMGGAC